ncbi:MAG: glycosyltransferase [Novosphingobium sp.]
MNPYVLSISTLFPSTARPAFGRFVANQMAALARRSDVDLLMVNPLGVPPWPLSRREPYACEAAVPRAAMLDGVPVSHPRFPLIPVIGGDTNPARIAHAVLPMVRQLHRQRPFDLVDAQFFFPDGPAAALIAADLGLPLSIKARGSDIHYWGTRPKARQQMLAAANQASGMLAVSGTLRQDMAALGMPEERISVHYTGLDHARFHPTPRAAARAALGLTGGPLFVCPGALIAIKGQAFAIQALAAIPGARLALAGAGPDEASLRALAQRLGLADRVLFLGQVGHDVLPQWLSAADAVVLPSEREGLANAWIEALACGAPLVIPDIGGAAEVVSTPSAGRLAKRTPQAIADALQQILAAPPAQAEVAANVARFSWEANAAQLSAHYHRLAGR